MNCKPIQWIVTLALGLGAAKSARAQIEADRKHGYKGHLVQGEWKKAWTTTLTADINGSGLMSHRESQIDKMCPGYASSNSKRQMFWQQLMISLSWKESLHGARNYVQFHGGVNNGLFQINPVLRTAYGCGSIDLFNPLSNISCAVKMATHLVQQFGSFLKGSTGGMAAYWQPLRATSAQNTRNRNFILSAVKGACRSGHLVYHSTNRPTSMDGSGVSSELVTNSALAKVDLNYNTTDDLGLPSGALEPADAAYEYPYDAPNFEFDPESGIFFDLVPQGI